MKMTIMVSLCLFALALSACSRLIQSTPDAVPTLTLTTIPTPTAIPAPTNTPLPPTETPEGRPAAEWNGIPIMPGALTGEGDEEGYVFTVKATPLQIREYYELELGRLGWQPFAGENGDASMLIFMNNDSESLTISIIAKGDEALVLLMK